MGAEHEPPVVLLPLPALLGHHRGDRDGEMSWPNRYATAFEEHFDETVQGSFVDRRRADPVITSPELGLPRGKHVARDAPSRSALPGSPLHSCQPCALLFPHRARVCPRPRHGQLTAEHPLGETLTRPRGERIGRMATGSRPRRRRASGDPIIPRRVPPSHERVNPPVRAVQDGGTILRTTDHRRHAEEGPSRGRWRRQEDRALRDGGATDEATADHRATPDIRSDPPMRIAYRAAPHRLMYSSRLLGQRRPNHRLGPVARAGPSARPALLPPQRWADTIPGGPSSKNGATESRAGPIRSISCGSRRTFRIGCRCLELAATRHTCAITAIRVLHGQDPVGPRTLDHEIVAGRRRSGCAPSGAPPSEVHREVNPWDGQEGTAALLRLTAADAMDGT